MTCLNQIKRTLLHNSLYNLGLKQDAEDNIVRTSNRIDRFRL
jgi:hypothetical protein